MNSYYTISNDCKRLAAGIVLLLFNLKSFALLVCPANQTITTQPFECEAQLDFHALAWSNSNPLTDTVFSPGPGYDFPIGNTTVTLTVTEIGGNMLACTFTVTVQMFNNNSMACGDNVTIDLDADCTHTISADEVLLGQIGCPEKYNVIFISPLGGIVPAIATVDYLNGPNTFKVTNTITNSACWGSFIVNSGSLPFEIVCPPDTIVNCNSTLDPSEIGTASFTTCLDSDQVNLVHFDNFTSTNCNSPSTFELLRTWQATDIYGNQRQCQQHISARRNTLDEIVYPNDLTLTCEQISLDSNLLEINSSGRPLIGGLPIGPGQCDMSVEMEDSIANICGASFDLLRKWIVIEWCNIEVVSHTQVIHVADDAAPAVALQDTIFISTNPVCGLDALFPAAHIDDCSATEVLVTTPWNTTSTNGGYIAVNTIAGTYTGSYSVTDACGNNTLEPIALQVQSGIISHCPADTTISCDYFQGTIAAALALGDSTVFEQLGLPDFYENCQLTRTLSLVIVVDSCGAGHITRTMGSEETSDQCTQQIEVAHISDFVVQFPADITINCGQNPFTSEEPLITAKDCEHIQISHTDALFPVQGTDACYKIVRNWVVKNTCIADTVNQIVEQPESALGANCDLDGDGDCDSRTFKDGGDGYLAYEQVIKIKDNFAPVFINGCDIPDVVADSGQCAGTVLLPVPEVLECGEFTVSALFKIGGIWLTGFGPYMNVPIGTYEVRYTAQDFCNNQVSCTTTVMVKDASPPVAQCKNGIVVELFAFGNVDIWASDFDNGSTDDCAGPLKFSFSQDINDIHRILDCADVGLVQLQIWVTDKGGNQSFCNSDLIVNAGQAECEPPYLVGYITTENNLPAENFLVTSSIGNTYTDASGMFELGYLTNPTTEIIPVNNENPKNGVTTFDVVLIRKHILGNQFLDSPYKIIAADANHSNTVTTFDLVVITKVILGNLPNFTDNTSWRFVPKGFTFPVPQNPFWDNFPESIVVTLIGPFYFDFIAIKVGDVNGSASPNFFGANDDKLRAPNDASKK